MSALDKITSQAGQGLDALLNNIIHGADKALGFVAGKVVGAFTPSGDSSGASIFASVKETFLGAFHGASSSPSQEVAVARAPEVSVAQAPTVQKDAYSCTMNDVVCPVTPKINTNNVGIGV